MRLSLRLAHECATCGSLDWENRDLVPLLLTGEPYAFCPNCGSEVDGALRSNKAFRRKWRRAYNKLLERFKKGEMVKIT